MYVCVCNFLLMLNHSITMYWFNKLKITSVDYIFSLSLTHMPISFILIECYLLLDSKLTIFALISNNIYIK